MPNIEDIIEVCDMEVPIDILEEGNFIKNGNWTEDSETVHFDIKHMRAAMKDIYEVYSNPRSTKKDFTKVLEKHREARNREIEDYIDTLTLDEEKLLRVAKKVKKGNKITVVFEEVSVKEKGKLVKSIANKLFDKMTPKQIKTMLQESVRKLNDVDKLNKINQELLTIKPQIEGSRGCFRLMVNDEEVFLIR